MNRITRFLLLGLMALVWSAVPSLAQKRIALVIGNSEYEQLQILANPRNDAHLMALTLNKLGFEVISATDANRIAISRAVRKFGKALRKGGKDTVGLFYYAGHGVQARGENYLIPLGAEVEDEADLDIEAISASVVLTQMEAAGNSLNLVILDACRNNPFKGKMRSSSRGLARVNAASGSLVAFAAAPGQTAADGNSENSPYTTALVEAMQVPGLSVEQMFKRVRISVETQTNNQQTPWEESSLRGDFFFTPKAPEPKLLSQPKGDPAAREWVNIQNVQSTAVLKAFIKRHPTSIYAEYAKAILAEKIATAPALKKTQEDRTKIAVRKLQEQQKIASLQKPDEIVPAPKPKSPYELTILLQAELTRVGCDPGAIDGQWGDKGRRALARFKKYTALNLPYKDVSPEMLGAVKHRRSSVCPKPMAEKAQKTIEAENKQPSRKSAKKREKTWLEKEKEYCKNSPGWAWC